MKREMNVLDIAAFVAEAGRLVRGARISNIYHLDKVFLLKLRARGSTFFILVKVGSFITITEKDIAEKTEPSLFCRLLRKHLRGGIVEDLKQPVEDRVLELLVSVRGSKKSLVFEFMRGGNIILVDDTRRVLAAYKYVEYRDHKVKAGAQYSYPPMRGKCPTSPLEEYLEVFSSSEFSTVKTLALLFNLSGELAEEVCKRAGVDKKIKARELSSEEVLKIHTVVNQLFSSVRQGSLSPRIYFKAGGKYSFSPIPMLIYENLTTREYSEFSKLLYEYFKDSVVETLSESKLKRINETKRRLEASIKQVEKAIRENRKKAERIEAIAKTLLSQIHLLSKALAGEEVDLPVSIKISGRKIVVCGIVEATLPTTSGKIVEKIFERAKEYKRKAQVAEERLLELKQRLKELENQRKILIKKTESTLKKPSRKTMWYEQFLWFFTSENFLVIGGKTASQNEVLVRKYLQKGDLFFHADIHGAPVVILKNGEKAGEASIREAAEFAASYSRAWTMGFSSIEVYYVKADQVSKTPPSGEYLSKGAFMVRGKRNYLKVELKIAIGVDKNTLSLIAGPVSAIAPRAHCYVIIVPGRLDKNLITKKLKKFFEESTGQKFDLNNILKMIPGNSSIIRKILEKR